MTRTIADLTDDEIVDAIASFGVEGIDSLIDSDNFDLFMRRVGANIGYSRLHAEQIEARLENLFYFVRLSRIHAWTLSAVEWGKRLASRSAEDIARMLAGEA